MNHCVITATLAIAPSLVAHRQTRCNEEALSISGDRNIDATAINDNNGQDLIAVTFNDAGAILVSRQIKQETADYRSYRVTCTGSGC